MGNPWLEKWLFSGNLKFAVKFIPFMTLWVLLTTFWSCYYRLCFPKGGSEWLDWKRVHSSEVVAQKFELRGAQTKDCQGLSWSMVWCLSAHCQCYELFHLVLWLSLWKTWHSNSLYGDSSLWVPKERFSTWMQSQQAVSVMTLHDCSTCWKISCSLTLRILN